VQLTQIQFEVIAKAHAEAQVDPRDVARLLLHNPGDVLAAMRELADKGLLETVDGSIYSLTAEGETVHRATERSHRTAVIRRMPSWQPR
jgi:Mn-dependent DtxR family transcriptional regulator